MEYLKKTGSWRIGIGFGCITLGLIAFCGCSTSHYRKAADKEVYRIVEQVEGRIFGRTNEFSIDTPYSKRKPEEILPPELIEDRLQTNRRVLTIQDALRLAAEQSRRYQTEKERLYLTALTLTGQRYEFTPQFFGRTTANLDRTTTGETVGSVNSQVGVGQVFKTGGRLGVTIANDLLRYYTGDPRRSAVSAISVNLTQPLLRGFGRNNPAVESLTQAERNVVYAVRDFSYFQDEFALQIVGDYFNLLAQKDIIRNRYTNYLSRVDSTRRLEKRAVDRETQSGVDQARQAELTARNNYVNQVAGFKNAVDQFKILLGLPLGEKLELDDSALEEVKATGLITVEFEPEQAYRLAVTHQLPFLNEIDRFEDAKRKVRVSANRLKPDLNLLADASLASEGPTDYTQFDPDDVRAGVGLQLDLPFSRLPERNNYRATIVSFEAQLRDFTLTLDTLRDSIERGLRTLEQRRQNYQIQKNALELANRRVASTELLMQAGRAEVRDLVEAQDAQINAQNAVTAAVVDHQEARLQLMLAIGALQTEQEKFWLKDHLAGLMPVRPASTRQAETSEEPLLPPHATFIN